MSRGIGFPCRWRFYKGPLHEIRRVERCNGPSHFKQSFCFLKLKVDDFFEKKKNLTCSFLARPIEHKFSSGARFNGRSRAVTKSSSSRLLHGECVRIRTTDRFSPLESGLLFIEFTGPSGLMCGKAICCVKLDGTYGSRLHGYRFIGLQRARGEEINTTRVRYENCQK